MFHRVKSETVKPSADEAVKQDNEKIEESIEIEDEAIAEAGNENSDAEDVVIEEIDTQENTEEVETAQITETQTSPENEKDIEEMNDTAPETNETTTASYQPNAAVGGYPGSYPGYAASASAAPVASSQPSEGDRRLTIGAGITMSGEIEACDYLLVEGTVEAALKGASILEIAQSGVFYGTVEIENAEIAGRFEGDITATGRLTLREGATVTGSIAYKELEIESGAIIDGRLTPLQAVQAAAVNKPSATKKVSATKAKAQDAVETAPAPANTDGGLFTKAAAVSE